jgi:hypothetical protein
MKAMARLFMRCNAGLLAAAVAQAGGALAAPGDGCVPVGQWVVPATGETVPYQAFVDGLARRDVVLLGEAHDRADHHHWQLHTIAALRAHKPDLVLGFEAFPRRVQPVLDRWVNGELSEQAFLAEADWRRVWRFDPALYLPLFHFARINRVPMIALNIEQSLIARVSEEGWAALPAAVREGVGRSTVSTRSTNATTARTRTRTRRPSTTTTRRSGASSRRSCYGTAPWPRRSIGRGKRNLGLWWWACSAPAM